MFDIDSYSGDVWSFKNLITFKYTLVHIQK